jgi:hypothetical protein
MKKLTYTIFLSGKTLAVFSAYNRPTCASPQTLVDPIAFHTRIYITMNEAEQRLAGISRLGILLSSFSVRTRDLKTSYIAS